MKSQTFLPLIDFLLLTIMWLIRTRSESVLTVVVELLCSKKKKIDTITHHSWKKNPQLKNKCSFPKWNHLFDPFPLVNFLLLHRLEQLPELVQLKHLLSPLTAEYQLILLAILCTVDELAGMSTYTSQQTIAWHIGEFLFDMWVDINQ